MQILTFKSEQEYKQKLGGCLYPIFDSELKHVCDVFLSDLIHLTESGYIVNTILSQYPHILPNDVPVSAVLPFAVQIDYPINFNNHVLS